MIMKKAKDGHDRSEIRRQQPRQLFTIHVNKGHSDGEVVVYQGPRSSTSLRQTRDPKSIPPYMQSHWSQTRSPVQNNTHLSSRGYTKHL